MPQIEKACMESESLPLEVVDLILEHLRNDRSALTACSLVSKPWHSRCRFHILADYVINPYSIKRKSPPPCDQSVLGQYTRTLLLTQVTMNAPWPEEAQFYTQVTTLYLMWSGIDRTMQTRISSTFTLVSRLELHNNHFESLVDMVQMICSLPMLETLTLVKCQWSEEPGEPIACRPSSKLWRSLSIQSTRLDPIIEWLLSLKPLPRLTTFGVDTLHHHTNLNSIGDAITSLGDSLQHLSLASIAHDGEAAKRINLSNNAKLCKLNVLSCSSVKFLIDLLTSNNSHSSELKEITLSTSLPDDSGDWQTLDRLLVDLYHRTNFTKLTYLVPARSARLEEPKMDSIDAFARLMPGCMKLDVLRVVSEGEMWALRAQGLVGLGRIRIADPFMV